MTQRDNRRSALAQIHIAQKQLGMDDAQYRDLLESVTGQRSCSGMHISDLYKVIKRLEQCGFQRKKPSSRQQKKRYSPKASGKYIDVMRAVWIEMYQSGMINDGSELALTGWAKRQSSQLNGGIGIDELEWLERKPAIAEKVLESLKQWRGRLWRQWQEEDIALVNQLIKTEAINPAEAIVRLLKAHRIMHWPQFIDHGVDTKPEYCTNRKDLQ